MEVIKLYSICLLLLLTKSVRVTGSCYFPDGVQATEDVPCSLNNATSFCCFPGQTCLSNQLCGLGGSSFTRGTCTDQTWKSDACPFFCLDGNSDHGIGVSSCGNGLYCCASNTSGSTDCCSGSNLFKLSNGVHIVDLPRASSTTSTSRKAILTVTITTGPPASTASGTSSGIFTPPAVASLSMSSVSNFPSTSPLPSVASNTGLSPAAKISIGVAVPVALVLLIMAGLALYRLGRKRAHYSEPEERGVDGFLPAGGSDTFPPAEKDGATPRAELSEQPLTELGS